MAVLLLTSCTSEDSMPSPDTTQDMAAKRAELQARPSIEDTDQRYLALEAAVKQALTERFGARWQSGSERGSSGCRSHPGVGGQEHSSPTFTFEPALSDADWPEAQRIVTTIGHEHGFADPETVVDRPDDHVIVGHDDYGGSYRLGTARRTTFSTRTGCHLPQEHLHPDTQDQPN
ncbi:LppA family lipoprotein [Saccharopolyspora cebuensis]|uniref:LppA family lipoprotein n=1 Tax=Saccharopolyspora cebuensis TaxID=418759 RepID=A0ABV4CQB6_9PSEU